MDLDWPKDHGVKAITQALNYSDTSTIVEASDLAHSTAAVVFLGTPHRGGGQYADLGEAARKCASILLLSTNRRLLDALGLHNDDLVRNQNGFSRLWQKYDFQVKTFQESLPMTGINVPLLPTNKLVSTDFNVMIRLLAQ